jgi:hypothetical protein
MNHGQGSIFGSQQQQPGAAGQSEVIIQGLHELIKWTPMTQQGMAVVQGALGLIGQLQRATQSMIGDPYWQLRKFGEAMLSMVAPSDREGKRIFFHNYEKNEVYMGWPAVPEQELPPIVLKATLGVEAVVTLSLDEAVTAVQEAGKRIESWVFGMELKEEPAPSPYASWEFLMRIEENPFESSFEMNFRQAVDDLGVPDPKAMYQAFKDKFNLNAILNGANRPFLDLHVFCVEGELHWDWVTRK